ncbi:2-oxoglutarate dehydrogenase [Variovorax sp. JS1663]|nr:2-oxoglutarate dehydrogenase [Variovorax sp. JS1663]
MALFSAWLIALVSTLGALFLGEVMGRTPCVLCWYQRIAMFPLVVILAMGLLPVDLRSVRYAMPLAMGGWTVALHHCLLYWGVVPKGLVPCGQGASCTDAQLALAGFLSIPLLSLMAFTFIVALLVVARKEVQK